MNDPLIQVWGAFARETEIYRVIMYSGDKGSMMVGIKGGNPFIKMKRLIL